MQQLGKGTDRPEEPAHMKILYIGILQTIDDCAQNPFCSDANNRFQTELLKAFGELGCNIHVLALESSSTRHWRYRPHRTLLPSSFLKIIEVPFVSFGLLQPLSQSLSISGYLAVELIRWKPDAIITDVHYARYGIPALLAHRATHLPLLTILSDTPAYKGLHRFLPRQLLELLVIKRSPIAATFSNNVTQDYRVNARTIRISVPASQDVFKISTERRYFESNGENIVYFAGNLSIYSGTDILLEAIKLIPNPEYRFWFSGRGALQEDVLRMCESDNRIKFWGFVDRKQYLALMEQATILVNPRPYGLAASRYNFPSKLMEYMAAGRPVVSTATSDIREFYRNSIVIVEDDKPETLAKAIVETCELPFEERLRLGESARGEVQTETYNRQAVKLLDLIESIR